jgi:hypothetical protein
MLNNNSNTVYSAAVLYRAVLQSKHQCQHLVQLL